jgi:uncharacterized transporter YbjL
MNWLLQIHTTHAVAHRDRRPRLGLSGRNDLGNSLKELNETHFIPLFLGIAFGIAMGTMPIAMPGLPQPLRLGLAGGVLVVALVLGRIGRIGQLVWHMPANVSLAFREFGIALFFAAVGLPERSSFRPSLALRVRSGCLPGRSLPFFLSWLSAYLPVPC